jgi:site-specific recombinase XerD
MSEDKKIQLPHLDDFLLYLATQNYSEETIYNYERDLATFTQFLSTGGPSPISFTWVNKQIINEYKAYLNSQDRATPVRQEKGIKKLSSYSINRMLSSLRTYLKYLIDMDYDVPVAPEAIKLVKTEKKHPKVAEFEDLVRLIEAPSKLEKNPNIALRNRAILEVLFSTGMRISEVCRLNKSDIDKTGRIFIMGKGKKERFVYLTPRARYYLENYLQARKDTYPALFIPYRGPDAPNKDKRISTNYIQAKIKEYREKLRINVPTSAHSLRHGFATYIAEQGASPAAIQILLGHESLNTTTRYVHASDRFAEETHRRFHPLKRPKGD